MSVPKTTPLRLIDTGLQSARWNVAVTAAMAELHGAGAIGDTIRLYRYRRSVLIGRHQSADADVNVAHCLENGIEIARRMTGGGAVYMDAGILAWDVIVGRRRAGGRYEDANALICAGVARGLARLNVPAALRGNNEIVIAGRRVSGSSGYHAGATFVCQGTVLVDFDPRRMAAALQSPAGGTAHDAAGLSRRLTCLADHLDPAPDCDALCAALAHGLADALHGECRPEPLSNAEAALAERLCTDDYGSDDFVFGGNGGSAGRAHVITAATGNA